MDPSHPQMHYHLARALMHLNQLAAFFPFFDHPGEWGSNPVIPRHHGQSSARHLHTFVPLPTDSAPPASLASHGGLPSHLVVNPEPNLRAISYRSLAHADASTNRALSSSPPPHRGTLRHDEDHLSASEPPFPRPKQASSSTAPRTTILIILLLAPGLKRPRAAYMVEAVNRFGSLPDDGASAHARPARHPVPEPEADPPPIHHRSVGSDSDEPEPAAAKASSPAPTIPGHVSPAPVIPVDLPAPVPTNLDPAVADHRNRPWPPCDDREFAQYKVDTKSRPSWKTIAKRMTAQLKAVKPDGNG